MTSTSGDLPDWQTLVTPQVKYVSIGSLFGSQNQPMISSGQPYRIWAVMISMTFASENGYAAALGDVVSQLTDGAGGVIAMVNGMVTNANQVSSGNIAFNLSGVTPVKFAGLYTLRAVTSANPANTDYITSFAAYYSQP